MKLVSLFFVALAMLPAATRAAGEPKIHIAIAPFTSAVGGSYTSQAVESAITDALVNGGRYDVVARSQLDKVLAEQSLNNSQLVDPKAAQKVLRKANAPRRCALHRQSPSLRRTLLITPRR